LAIGFLAEHGEERFVVFLRDELLDLLERTNETA
jgi:hypothetical protein